MISPEPPKPSIDFLDASPSQLIKSNTTIPVSPGAINIISSGDQYWKQKGAISSYQKGLFFGRGDMSNIYLNEFIKKFRKVFEDIVREELKAKNQTFEAFKDDFKALEMIFNMILRHLSSNAVELKDEKNIAIMHGFITSYVDSLTPR